MARRVKLNQVRATLQELSYPISRGDAGRELDDVTLLLADGEENLGGLVSQTDQAEYESPSDLESEINNVLPREAVGEPYQSEGEG